jgi:hypothetical protein
MRKEFGVNGASLSIKRFYRKPKVGLMGSFRAAGVGGGSSQAMNIHRGLGKTHLDLCDRCVVAMMADLGLLQRLWSFESKLPDELQMFPSPIVQCRRLHGPSDTSSVK